MRPEAPPSPASAINIRACSMQWPGKLQSLFMRTRLSCRPSPRKPWPIISSVMSPAALPTLISSAADRKRSKPASSWRGNISSSAASAPLLSSAFSHVTPAFAYHEKRDDEGDSDFVARLAAELEAEFLRLGPATVAAFIAEPVVGATAGCVPAPEGYFRAVREICDRHGALVILDEVMCGMGRTGTTHAWEQEGIAPDIQAIAKGLGGGYQPIGAMLARAEIVDTIRKGSGAFQHGHTYLGHPLACAAALEVQLIIRDEKLLDQVKQRGNLLERRLTERFGNHRHIGDIRGRGLFQAIELVVDRARKTPFDPALKLNQKIKAAAFEHGLACYPTGGTVDGRSGDHVLLAPPYIATPDDIDLIVEKLGSAVDVALRKINH